MGTAGLVGQIMTFQTMAAAEGAGPVLFKIALLHFLLPGVMAFAIAWFMRKKGWIQDGDMKLDM